MSDIKDIDAKIPFLFEIFNNLFNHHHNKTSRSLAEAKFNRSRSFIVQKIGHNIS